MLMVNILFNNRKHILNQKCVLSSAEISDNNSIAFSVSIDFFLDKCFIFFHFCTLRYRPIYIFDIRIGKKEKMRSVIVSFFIRHQIVIIYQSKETILNMIDFPTLTLIFMTIPFQKSPTEIGEGQYLHTE